MTTFVTWAERWMQLALHEGAHLPDQQGRIEQVLALWAEPVPDGWQRREDAALVDPAVRYRRTHKSGPRGEHALEWDVLEPDPARRPAVILGEHLVDGINAVSLARDVNGGRAGNVEADMLLLVRDDAGQFEQVLVEVKVASDYAWYAVVEHLRQLRLFSESTAARAVLATRRSEEALREVPYRGLVLAPESFYTGPGRRSASVAPARALIEQVHELLGLRIDLAVWDSAGRTAVRHGATTEPEERDHLADAVGVLPEAEKLVMALLHYEELTVPQAAQVLQVPFAQLADLYRGALGRLEAAGVAALLDGTIEVPPAEDGPSDQDVADLERLLRRRPGS